MKELVSLLDEICELLGLEQSAEDIRDGTSFLGAIDDVLEQLEHSHFEDEEMGWRMQLILQHAMTVSKFSGEEDRIEITRYSQRVLNEYRSLQSLLHNLENSPSDISLAVDIFRDFLELMEQSVNHSLLRMMVEVNEKVKRVFFLLLLIDNFCLEFVYMHGTNKKAHTSMSN